MGGKGKDIDDTKDWPKANEVTLIQILVGKVREGKLQSSTFKKEVWAEINNEMHEAIGVDYGIDRLKDPLSPIEERRLEEEFLSGSIHVDLEGNSSEGEGSEKGRKRKIDSIPGERRSSKVNKMNKMEEFLDKWASALSAKEEAAKAKAERYKLSIPDPYSIGICMELLEKMEWVSSRSYNKAIEKFISAEWRQIFVGMSEARRKDWVDSLDEF
ncbi:hypothetical protein V6N13_109378 [Hibiscus sabdariffa]